MVQLPMIKGLGIIRPGLLGPGQYTAVMMAARHLRLALALILGLASATKRPRSNDSSDLEQSESSASATTTTTITTTTTATTAPTLTPTGAGPAIKDTDLYFLKRAIQITGCLFNDPVACSGDFDDPTRYAAVLLSNMFKRKYPEYEPINFLSRDLSSVEQLRSEFVRQARFNRGYSFKEFIKAEAYQLQVSAAKRLIGLTFGAGDEGMSEYARTAIKAWDGHVESNKQILSATNELFMAAERTTARFDRGVFVWPAGQSNVDPLHPEERVYAAAVVIMCWRLGVRPVSVFLITREFERSLPLARCSWRRPAVQVISMAAGESLRGIDLAELCRSFVGWFGISDKLDFVPIMERYRHKVHHIRAPKYKPQKMKVLAKPVNPLPPAPPEVPLPTVLREDFAETDRLLLIRSLQVAYLLLSQTAADQSQFSSLFFQASTVISYLLKLNDHVLPSDLVANKPESDFGPLDLLRVIAGADRRPDLSAVSTVGDVMIAAAQMIFRHLYLALPVTVLTKVEAFSVVKLPEAHLKNMGTLASHLRIQGAPHIPSDSSTLTELYEATDAILWAAFRVLSKRRGSSNEAFVLCTREMSEKIPIARQQAHYLISATLWRMFDKTADSVEAAVLDLLDQLVREPEDSSGLQMPDTISQAPGAVSRASSAIPRASDRIPQTSSVIFRASNTMPHGSGALHQVPAIAPQAPATTPQAATASDQVAASKKPRNSTSQILSKAMTIMGILFPGGSIPIQSLRDILSMVLMVVPTDLAKTGELTSANRLVMTLQLQKLDVKLKRKNIPFSDTDHVTVLMDALVALHFLQQGAAAQLAGIPRTRTSDIGTEDKGNLACVLVSALFDFTLVEPAEEGSMSTAFSELTKILVSAVEAATSG